MIVKNDSVAYDIMAPGIKRKIIATGGKMMAVEVHLKNGAIAAVHTHPHEQIGYILKGSLEIEIDGKKNIIKTGDSFYASPYTAHGAIALEDTIALDIFTPQRQDFLR